MNATHPASAWKVRHDVGDPDMQLLEQLRADIAHNRLVLPSLPDVARKVRTAVEDPRASAEKVARTVGTDAAMSARLLKVANSPLYRRNGSSIDDVRTAVTRLGLSLVRTLIVNLSIVQIMRPPRGGTASRLHAVFEHSTRTSAWSYALAARYTDIGPDEAMLAGMVHDIGYLPILQYAGLAADEDRLQQILDRHHPQVGAMVLETWNFGERFTSVAAEHENVYRTGYGAASLVDIVIAAQLFAGHERRAQGIDRHRVPALRKLGLDADADPADDPRFRGLLHQAASIARA